MSAVRATPFLADAPATPASRPQSTGSTDGSFAVQLLGVTADAAKTSGQKPAVAPASTAGPAVAPATSTDGAIADAVPVDAAPAKLADLPTIDARGLGGRAADKSGVDKSDASKPAPDGSDTPGLLAMVALAQPVPMTSVAPAVPVAAGATDETAANGGSVPVSLVSAAAAAAAAPAGNVAAPAGSVAAPAGQTPPSVATETVALAASTGSATETTVTNPATATAAASISSATDPASTGSATASVDTPPARARLRTTPPEAAASTGSATGNVSTAAATGVPAPVVPVQQGDTHTKDESANEPPLAAVASAASVPAAVTAAGATAAPAPVAQPAPTQAFTDQIARPILTLREAAPGTHVLTIRVAPDSLGPVTVRAHLGADGIRIELLAPTDQGRNALNAILPDLKRDLAQGGMNSTVNVSSQPDANAQQNASGQFGARADAGAAGSGGQSARQDAWPSRAGSQPTHPQTPLRPATVGGTSLLDVYA